MEQGRINQANGRLKAALIRCKISRCGNSLYLQATFPPKPGSGKLKPHQQRLSLGLSATPENIKLAESQARKIGALLEHKEFSWEPYLRGFDPGLTNPVSVADWVNQFHQDYFLRRKKTPQSLTTWTSDYHSVFRQLPQELPLSEELMKELIAKTKPDSKTRKRTCMALGLLAKFAQIDFDPKPYKGKYSPKKVTPRELPEDSLIASTFYTITDLGWRNAYALMAVYGIRPHEIFYSELGSGDFLNLLDGKTGPRRIWPLYPEWKQEFELFGELVLPKVRGRANTELGNRVCHAFKRFNIPFRPYDLRHCWAIRSLEFGLDISLAAQQMGHSVAVHTDLYHLWISDRHHQRAFDLLKKRGDRPFAPQVLRY